MATINIAFDLADDGQARDFRASSVAPELLRVLVDFFIHAADPKSPLAARGESRVLPGRPGGLSEQL